jgi:hypothetical protein
MKRKEVKRKGESVIAAPFSGNIELEDSERFSTQQSIIYRV